MKFTLPEMIEIWRALNETEVLNDKLSAQFTTFKKRFQLKTRPEIAFWDSLSEDERVTFMSTKIDVDMNPIKVRFLPNDLPIDRVEALSKIVDSEIELNTTPTLKQLVEKSKPKEEPQNKKG